MSLLRTGRTLAVLTGAALALLTPTVSAMAATTSAPVAKSGVSHTLKTSAGVVSVAADGTVSLNGKVTGNVKNAVTRSSVRTLAVSSGNTYYASRPNNPSGWDTSWNPVESNCSAKANVAFTASTNPADPTSTSTNLNATVSNPYLFTGCRLATTVTVGTSLGFTYTGASRSVLGCSRLDPTCGWYASGNWQIDNETPDVANMVNFLRMLGYPVTAGSLVSSVGLSFARG